MNGKPSSRHMSLLVLRTMFVIACTGCAAQTVSPPLEVARPPVASDELGPGDVIVVRVFREQDLSGKFRVPDEGVADFPLIGAVGMKGKTPQELEEEITVRLREGFLVEPQVTVFVEERNSQRVYVLGQVEKPGTFPFTPNMTVIEAITLAGGFAQVASRNSVKLSRTVEGREIVMKVSAGDISSGSKPNVFLRPGDIIFVPEAIF